MNIENKEMNPERWLPKWQRAKYRKLALKKGMHVTQGDIKMSLVGIRIENLYKISRKIGSGSFGEIYLGTLVIQPLVCKMVTTMLRSLYLIK